MGYRKIARFVISCTMMNDEHQHQFESKISLENTFLSREVSYGPVRADLLHFEADNEI
jgi:hypothetical protein